MTPAAGDLADLELLAKERQREGGKKAGRGRPADRLASDAANLSAPAPPSKAAKGKAAKRPSKDERRVLALVALALEGEGPDAGGVGPLLRQVAFLGERLAQRLGVDVSALVAERLEMGRATYGALDLATDRRDFQREALEELVDALAYLAMESVRRGVR